MTTEMKQKPTIKLVTDEEYDKIRNAIICLTDTLDFNNIPIDIGFSAMFHILVSMIKSDSQLNEIIKIFKALYKKKQM